LVYEISIIITRSAQKEFVGIDREFALKIKNDIEKLSSEPRPMGCIKLKKREGWRIRSGDYRVIYEINDDLRSINILHVGHRKDVYK
jgi:mRNA interferase RelE/StbE